MMSQTRRPLLRKDNKNFSEISIMNFALPPELEAGEPPEARGLARDEVLLMVSHISTNQIVHTSFRQIGDFLEPGDVLVINTSRTLNAALPATRSDGTQLELHLSTHLPANLWVIEMRGRKRPDHSTTSNLASPLNFLPEQAQPYIHPMHPVRRCLVSGLLASIYLIHFISTSIDMASQFAIVMSKKDGRLATIKQCMQRRQVARRCRLLAVPSHPSC